MRTCVQECEAFMHQRKEFKMLVRDHAAGVQSNSRFQGSCDFKLGQLGGEMALAALILHVDL